MCWNYKYSSVTPKGILEDWEEMIRSIGEDYGINTLQSYQTKDDPKEVRLLVGVNKEDIEIVNKKNYLELVITYPENDVLNRTGKKVYHVNSKDVDVAKIKATIANGILTLTLPLKEEEKPVKINIE